MGNTIMTHSNALMLESRKNKNLENENDMNKVSLFSTITRRNGPTICIKKLFNILPIAIKNNE